MLFPFTKPCRSPAQEQALALQIPAPAQAQEQALIQPKTCFFLLQIPAPAQPRSRHWQLHLNSVLQGRNARQFFVVLLFPSFFTKIWSSARISPPSPPLSFAKCRRAPGAGCARLHLAKERGGEGGELHLMPQNAGTAQKLLFHLTNPCPSPPQEQALIQPRSRP